MSELDALLVRRLRELDNAGKLHQVSIVRTGERYQANMKLEGSAFAVSIREDPIDALLVATGAVGELEMNRRNGVKAEPNDFDDLLG